MKLIKQDESSLNQSVPQKGQFQVLWWPHHMEQSGLGGILGDEAHATPSVLRRHLSGWEPQGGPPILLCFSRTHFTHEREMNFSTDILLMNNSCFKNDPQVSFHCSKLSFWHVEYEFSLKYPDENIQEAARVLRKEVYAGMKDLGLLSKRW